MCMYVCLCKDTIPTYRLVVSPYKLTCLPTYHFFGITKVNGKLFLFQPICPLQCVYNFFFLPNLFPFAIWMQIVSFFFPSNLPLCSNDFLLAHIDNYFLFPIPPYPMECVIHLFILIPCIITFSFVIGGYFPNLPLL